MIVGILQPSYLPWLGFFEQVQTADVFVLYDDVQFEKGGWRNRNRIKGPGGEQWITVPVLKGDGGPQKIMDVQIDSRSNWMRKHINALTLNYSRSPYFAKYSSSLFDIIGEPREKLIDLNVDTLKWLCSVLGISTELVRSSALNVSGDRIERLIKIIKHFNGDVFYEGAAGANYIDSSLFNKAGIEVRFQAYRHPVYTQLFGDFVPFLSVVDLLFNEGSRSLEILMGGACTDEC